MSGLFPFHLQFKHSILSTMTHRTCLALYHLVALLAAHMHLSMSIRKIHLSELHMVVHACNSSSWEAKKGGGLELKDIQICIYSRTIVTELEYMHVCMYICVVCIYEYIHIYVCMYMYIFIYIYMFTRVNQYWYHGLGDEDISFLNLQHITIPCDFQIQYQCIALMSETWSLNWGVYNNICEFMHIQG